MKMQNVSFRSIDEFLNYLPEDELKIVTILRHLILDSLPNCREKLSFNVPFYSLHNSICFIWPASIKWGKKETYKGVRIGFNKGYLMSDEHNYLEKGNRKQVFCHDLKKLEYADLDILKSYLFEAAIIDEQEFIAKGFKIDKCNI